VAQTEVRGVIAAAFDHYDSRAGDPQLHTHVVIANRVQAVTDGRWRTLDSRALHAAVVGLSEHYNALISDRISTALGTAWASRERGPNRNTAWDIAGVPEELMDLFSTRSAHIEQAVAELATHYAHDHGRQPSRRALIRLRQQATLETRPEKEHHSLAELTDTWRKRATQLLHHNATEWALHMMDTSPTEPVLHADDLPEDKVVALAGQVLGAVQERRSTWRRWNLHAEAARQTMPLRFATAADREAVIDRLVDQAQTSSTRLTPEEIAHTPRTFRRSDGDSVFRPRASIVFTSQQVLDAEAQLLDASRARAAPTVPLNVLERRTRAVGPDQRALGADQREALEMIASSARVLDILVGPAGTGKTTTMRALRQAWEDVHGSGSVIGLAPSAAAADVLAGELQISTENTAKWLHEYQRDHARLVPGQLVIIDEASMAGTLALDRITRHARAMGAKVLLVGDWAQLAAVDAGGAFELLVADRNDPPHLDDVRRFHEPWERDASLRLRLGDTSVLSVYNREHRIHEAKLDDALESAYAAWSDDRNAGRSSMMIADTAELVSQLNARARNDRVLAGKVEPRGISLHDGNQASRGDAIITRLNDRRLRLGRSWVKNGDRWEVLAARGDGSLTVRRSGTRHGGTITLPASYVADQVELGYAVTTHRAQGATVDISHTIVESAKVTREALYVAMTRGRAGNHVYVAIDRPDLETHQLADGDEPSAIGVLTAVLKHATTENSAHQTARAETEQWASIAQLVGEYETIAQTAQLERWHALLERGGLPQAVIEELIDSDTFGILTAELRRLDAEGHDIDNLLPRIVRAGGLEDADDLATLIRSRLLRVTNRYHPTQPAAEAHLIAGIFPNAAGVHDATFVRALLEREHLIDTRAKELAQSALKGTQP
jgi:hypothetical protein